jgi:heptosyltransferase-2
MRILVISFSHIGDAVLSTCIIQPLREAYPKAHLAFLLNPGPAPLLRGDPRVDEVLVYDKHHLHRGLKGKFKLIGELRGKRFDLVVDLRDSLWSRLIGGRRWRIKRELRRSRRHAVERYLDLLRSHGLNVVRGKPQIELREEEVESAGRFLAERGVQGGKRLIGIHPGGGWPYKLWGVDRFSLLADRLGEKLNADVLLFSGTNERNLAESVERHIERRVIKCEGLPLRVTAALMRRCLIYVGNDTGTTHLAAAVGVPTVAIFGPTDHMRSGPYGDQAVSVVGDLQMDCAPCHPGRDPGGCGKGVCPVIRSVEVERVIQACLMLVKGI